MTHTTLAAGLTREETRLLVNLKHTNVAAAAIRAAHMALEDRDICEPVRLLLTLAAEENAKIGVGIRQQLKGCAA